MNFIKFFIKETPEEALKKYRIFGKQIKIPEKIRETVILLEKETVKKSCLLKPNECAVCGKPPAILIVWKGFVLVDEPLGINTYIPQYIHICSMECLYKWLVDFYNIPLTPQKKLQQKISVAFFNSHLMKAMRKMKRNTKRMIKKHSH